MCEGLRSSLRFVSPNNQQSCIKKKAEEWSQALYKAKQKGPGVYGSLSCSSTPLRVKHVTSLSVFVCLMFVEGCHQLNQTLELLALLN